MKTKTCKDNIGYAVVGLGRGMAHVKSADKAENCDLLAVCDTNPETFKKVNEDYDVDTYENLDDMLARDDIDIVSICTPSGTHAEIALKVAKKGKHALLEKPFDIKVDRIDNAVKVFEDKNLKVGCIFQNRLISANQKIKEIIDSGALGKLILGTAQVKWYRTQEYYDRNDGWRGTWALDGGGSLMNQSIHTIDLLQWMMGPVESVFAYIDVEAHDIETEDMSTAVMRMKNGGKAVIIGSTATYPGFGTSLDIHGLNGGICMRNNDIVDLKLKDASDEEIQDILKTYGPDKDMDFAVAADPTIINKDTTFVQVQDIVDAVREDRDPIISGKEGRNAVEIICGIYESAKTGKEITL